jgi:hypothetical protein
MRRCRNKHSRVMVLECNGCHHQVNLPHSCGHRSCPRCQHHESQQWLERQKAQLLAVDYFMVTFTVPAHLNCWRKPTSPSQAFPTSPPPKTRQAEVHHQGDQQVPAGMGGPGDQRTAAGGILQPQSLRF